MLVFAVIAAVANIGLCFALIPSLGYNGAAYATLLAYALYTACVGFLGRRIFPWRVNLGRVVTFGGALIAGLVAIYFLRRAMSGIPYEGSLTVTVVASCASALAFLLALLRTMLKPGGPEGSGGPGQQGTCRCGVPSGPAGQAAPAVVTAVRRHVRHSPLDHCQPLARRFWERRRML